jgi:hypothetical protein
MRIVAASLVVVFLFHLQCSGSCVLNSSSGRPAVVLTSSDPPCHRHAEIPSKDQTPKHDANGPCDQGPPAQSTLSAAAKIALHITGILPADIGTPVADSPAAAVFNLDKPPHVSPPSIHISVLRI